MKESIGARDSINHRRKTDITDVRALATTGCRLAGGGGGPAGGARDHGGSCHHSRDGCQASRPLGLYMTKTSMDINMDIWLPCRELPSWGGMRPDSPPVLLPYAAPRFQVRRSCISMNQRIRKDHMADPVGALCPPPHHQLNPELSKRVHRTDRQDGRTPQWLYATFGRYPKLVWFGLVYWGFHASAAAVVISSRWLWWWWNVGVTIMEETRAPGGKHWPTAGDWQTFTHTACAQSQYRTPGRSGLKPGDPRRHESNAFSSLNYRRTSLVYSRQK